MPKLFIIAGPNGAGKTTASFTILPQILNCREFVNADEIARGLSPFNPSNVSFEAGRIMLTRINQLIESETTFAFETTLSTRSYVKLIELSKEKSYEINLIFLWLNSPELAIERVKYRVSQGGHDIPTDVIKRRYRKGLFNFLNLFQPVCDKWILADNSHSSPEIIAEGSRQAIISILQEEKWNKIANYGTE